MEKPSLSTKKEQCSLNYPGISLRFWAFLNADFYVSLIQSLIHKHKRATHSNDGFLSRTEKELVMPETERLGVPINVFDNNYRIYEVPSVVCSFAG